MPASTLTAGGLRYASMFAVNGHAALTPSLVAHSHYSTTLLESQYPDSRPGYVIGLTGFANFCRRRREFSLSRGFSAAVGFSGGHPGCHDPGGQWGVSIGR